MKYIIIHKTNPIFYFDINLEVTLKNLLSLISEAIGLESPDNVTDKEEKKPPKKSKNVLIFIIVVLTLLLFYSIDKNNSDDKIIPIQSNLTTMPTNRTSTDSKDIMYRHYHWQCKFIRQEFCTEFWKYVHQNKINTVENFTNKDKAILKEKLWKKLLKAREAFANLDGMSELEKEVSAYYQYHLFEKDFDTFIVTHNKGNIESFERNMIEYIRAKQNDILEKIIDR